MKINTDTVTLVDQVEHSLLNYFKDNDLRCGDPIPNEHQLADEFGVGRSVVREALSGLKMMGMINSRPRKGMVLSEPPVLKGLRRVVVPRILSDKTIWNLLNFRIALEIGISNDIFRKINDEEIKELDEIVKIGIASENNEYALISEFSFHVKLYNITRNAIISEFQEIIHPVLTYIRENYTKELREINIQLKQRNRLVTHTDLLECIKNRDEKGYRDKIEQHFEVYRILMKEQGNL